MFYLFLPLPLQQPIQPVTEEKGSISDKTLYTIDSSLPKQSIEKTIKHIVGMINKRERFYH